MKATRLEFILTHTQDLNPKDTALVIKADDGDLDGVKELVGMGADVNAKRGYALIMSIGLGYTDIVSFLLESGVSVETCINVRPYSSSPEITRLIDSKIAELKMKAA
jgi:hypothetical protein